VLVLLDFDIIYLKICHFRSLNQDSLAIEIEYQLH
jgi:hypothetical protein